jgi:hypothetical protein
MIEKNKIQEKFKDRLQKIKLEIKDKKWWITLWKIVSFIFGLVSLILALWGEKLSKAANILSLTSFSIAGIVELINELKLKNEKEELKDKKGEITISIISEEKEKKQFKKGD